MDIKKMLEESKAFNKKYRDAIEQGIDNGLVLTYGKGFIERLRNIYYGDIPVSLTVLCHGWCSGRCYDTALLVSGALEDMEYSLVDADVDHIKYNPSVIMKIEELLNKGETISEHYANHCFVEVKMGDKTWVIDTSLGLIIEKELYYSIQNPVITKVNSKNDVMSYIEYKDIKKGFYSHDMALLMVPFFEAMAMKDGEIYRELLLQEIDLFKKKINYEALRVEDEKNKRETLASSTPFSL